MKYDMFYDFLEELKGKTGLAKLLHPHSLRHARLTELAKKLTEAQLKTFAGWTPGSRMSGVYVHLSGSDLEKPLLSIYGKGEGEKAVSPLTPKSCPRCEMENPATSDYCQRCGLILDKNKAVTELMKREEIINKLQKQIQDLTKRVERPKTEEEVRRQEFLDMLYDVFEGDPDLKKLIYEYAKKKVEAASNPGE